jgi:hypothetical protein
MILHQRRLGCIPSRRDPRTLQLARYLAADLPPPPDTRRWDTPVTRWGVQGNDRYGNCVICTAAHALQAWAANESGDKEPIADAAVIELSRQMGATNGYMILDRLIYWRKNEMWANRLWAFAAVNPTDPNLMRHAINSLGCADIALSMPAAWQSQEIWGTGSGRAFRPGSWGEHSVPLVGYDADHVYMVTWGAIQAMTWAALAEYSGEAYALINPEWIKADSQSPSGFDLEALHADLREVTA